jgi:hypothetical protein
MKLKNNLALDSTAFSWSDSQIIRRYRKKNETRKRLLKSFSILRKKKNVLSLTNAAFIVIYLYKKQNNVF